jgi:conjugative transfer signal peptidase TraF
MADRSRNTPDLPLLAWGEQLRARRMLYRKMRRRFVVGGLSIGVLLGTILLPPRPLLVWNASSSAPVGLYGVSGPQDLKTGDMVIATLPVSMRALAASRHYLPRDVPLVKRVAAVAGDEVCALGRDVFINGSWVAARRDVDAAGRPMPSWLGCHVLRDGAVFLLMADQSASFDGRYFGITAGGEIIGKAHLLWRR